MRRILSFALIAALACQSVAAAQSSPTPTGSCVATDKLDRTQRPSGGGLLIQQICQNGQSIPQATIGVGLGSSAAVSTDVKAGQSFRSPATFETPADITIDVMSANGNQQRIAPKTSILQNVGSAGEFFSMAFGHATAFVLNRLSFYNFQSLKVVAASHGTIFDVIADPSKEVTVSITEGSLGVSRVVQIQLTQENKTVDGIQETDTITPAGTPSVTYPVPFPIYKVFQNAAEAKAFFQGQLTQAKAAGDQTQTDDAIKNIGTIDHLVAVPPAPGGVGAPLVAGIVVVIGVLAAVLATNGFNSKKTDTQTTPPNQSGSATVSGRARFHTGFTLPIRL